MSRNSKNRFEWYNYFIYFPDYKDAIDLLEAKTEKVYTKAFPGKYNL